MADRDGRVELHLSPDPRLVSGLVGAVEHLAEQAGFDTAARSDLAAATEEACRNTFGLLTLEHPTVHIQVETFGDRLEVVLEHQGEALPTAGLDTFFRTGAAEAGEGELTGLSLLSRVDRVQYQTEAGTSRMILVKYLHGPKP